MKGGLRMDQVVPSAGDLRALIARRQVEIYKLAALVDVHPGRLSQMLKGTIPLPDEVAQRVAAALQEETP